FFRPVNFFRQIDFFRRLELTSQRPGLHRESQASEAAPRSLSRRSPAPAQKNKEPATRPAPKIFQRRACATRSGGVVLGAVADRIQEPPLPPGRHDINSAQPATLFAKQASAAGLPVDLHLAEIRLRVFRRRRDTIE